MESEHWLREGPFLEVSFIMGLSDNNAIREVINKLHSLPIQIEIVDQNVDEIINHFLQGYPFDEEDPHSVFLHSLRLNLLVHLTKKLKATLQVERISSNTVMVDFWFNNEISDSEWHQERINDKGILDFIGLLDELYLLYDFEVGGIEIERNVLDLFDCDEMYPNECFRLEKLNSKSKDVSSHYLYLVWNTNNK